MVGSQQGRSHASLHPQSGNVFGSGKKYKKCCGAAPGEWSIEPRAIIGGVPDMNLWDPQHWLQHQFWQIIVPGREYHSPLPEELRRWHLYTTEDGHCTAVVLQRPGRPKMICPPVG